MFRLGLLEVLLVLPVLARAQFTYSTNADNTITITGYTGSDGEVDVPNSISGLPVTGIGFGAFESLSVTNVVLPDTVASIGDYAFYSCLNLTNVSIPDGVTNIGIDVFWNCTSLASVTIPTNINSIGADDFTHCTRLTQMTIPYGVQSIGDSAFANCYGLANIAMAGSITNVGPDAFYGCTSLTNVVLPASVACIGAAAFYGCTGLIYVALPPNLTSIPDGLFQLCQKLTGVLIPGNVANIGNYAFYSCSSLTNLAIPASVTNIGNESFGACYNLAALYFYGNAPALGSGYNFDGDTNLTIYCLPGTTGWGASFPWPNVPWLPQAQLAAGGFGGAMNSFGFNINWASGQTVAVDVCTNLLGAVWQPLQTNVLSTGSAYFNDPQWTNYPGRFYRLRSL